MPCCFQTGDEDGIEDATASYVTTPAPVSLAAETVSF